MLQEIKNSLEILQQHKVLLYPTDTVWGIGCDATSEIAVNKIYKIKQRSESKSLIILVDSIKMLQQYIPTISNKIIELLGKTSNPTTIIYSNPKGLAKNVVAAGLATRCTIQIAYAIGVAEPVSLYANTHGTSTIDDQKLQRPLLK